MRKLIFLTALAAMLAACAAPQPQVIQATVEVTRIVEVTRLVEATRLVTITSTPPASTVPESPATPQPGSLRQARLRLSIFWVSRELGQVNVKTTNESAAALSGLEIQCTVRSERTGQLLADKVVTPETIPAGEANVTWIQFATKSEHAPGFFLVDCRSEGIDPASAQFFSPGSESTLPRRPNNNGTAACVAALVRYDQEVTAYELVKKSYDRKVATYNELAASYLSALGAYNAAVSACE